MPSQLYNALLSSQHSKAIALIQEAQELSHGIENDEIIESNLYLAIKKSNSQAALALINAGVDVNQGSITIEYVDKQKNTQSNGTTVQYQSCLFYALLTQQPDIALALINAGADIHIGAQSCAYRSINDIHLNLYPNNSLLRCAIKVLTKDAHNPIENLPLEQVRSSNLIDISLLFDMHLVSLALHMKGGLPSYSARRHPNYRTIKMLSFLNNRFRDMDGSVTRIPPLKQLCMYKVNTLCLHDIHSKLKESWQSALKTSSSYLGLDYITSSLKLQPTDIPAKAVSIFLDQVSKQDDSIDGTNSALEANASNILSPFSSGKVNPGECDVNKELSGFMDILR